jgi:hypothetical protein
VPDDQDVDEGAGCGRGRNGEDHRQILALTEEVRALMASVEKKAD